MSYVLEYFDPTPWLPIRAQSRITYSTSLFLREFAGLLQWIWIKLTPRTSNQCKNRHVCELWLSRKRLGGLSSYAGLQHLISPFLMMSEQKKEHHYCGLLALAQRYRQKEM